MTKILWIMWLGDVARSIKDMGGTLFLMFAASVVFFGLNIMFSISLACPRHRKDPSDPCTRLTIKHKKTTGILGVIFLILFIIFEILQGIMPSQATLYTYAGIEAGKTILTTGAGKQIPYIATKALKLLNQKLDEQLESESK
jgi:hypothetical protein